LTVLLTLLSFDLLELGSSGVGWLAAAIGVGGIVGAAISIAVIGAVVVGLGYVLPLAIMAGLAFALYRRISRPKPVTGIAAPASPAA